MIMMMQVLATESASYLYSEQDITEINMPGSWKPGNSGKSERIDAYSPPAADGPFPVYVWLRLVRSVRTGAVSIPYNIII